ncbi:hypothetical protein JKG47_19305 [Acidithiobacillus sp. MC6.1]|nr:hypothetical protein [Acidithiobacillus sp. MC6.1]
MSNVHPFPRKPAKGKPGKHPGKPYTLPDAENQPVDILVTIVRTGANFLTIPEETPPEQMQPTAPFWRVHEAVQDLDSLADVLLLYARSHADEVAPEDADELKRAAGRVRKLFHKLEGYMIPDELVVSIPSMGPDFLVETLTLTAISAATHFGLTLLNFYGLYFIQTSADQRKKFFQDFYAAYDEAHQQSLEQIEDHKAMVRDLTAIHRALGKHLTP